jgi:hypothetical protein
MTGSILEPWNKTIRITILGQPVDVPDNNLLLRCLQHLLPETVPYGRFCWNDECGNSEFRYRLPGDKRGGTGLSLRTGGGYGDYLRIGSAPTGAGAAVEITQRATVDPRNKHSRIWTMLRLCALLLAASLILVPELPAAEDGTSSDDKIGWGNGTELSLVITEGNSNTDTIGFKNTLTRVWDRSNFRLHMDSVRANQSDDRFLLLEAGLTFLPGETIAGDTTTLVVPTSEPDVEKYFIEGKYTRNLSGKKNWNAGASWDRNEDSGILNRYIVFGGAGTDWKDGEKLNLHTGYGVSYTDREEDTPDPEKEAQFFGFRGTLDLDYQALASTLLEFRFTGNLNLEDRSDYSIDSTSSVSVAMNERLSLKTSLQFLFNSEPALEDVDVFARLLTVDPDGVPGTGDEYLETVTEGGAEILIGEDRTRKDHLDTVFRTSLVITF